MSWLKSKTAKQIKQLVVMGSFNRRYGRDFANIVRPMVELTRTGKKCLCTEACDRSFDQMKKALVSADAWAIH